MKNFPEFIRHSLQQIFQKTNFFLLLAALFGDLLCYIHFWNQGKNVNLLWNWECPLQMVCSLLMRDLCHEWLFLVASDDDDNATTYIFFNLFYFIFSSCIIRLQLLSSSFIMELLLLVFFLELLYIQTLALQQHFLIHFLAFGLQLLCQENRKIHIQFILE